MFLKNGLKVIKIPKIGSQTFLIGFVVSTGLLVEIGYFPKGISELVRLLFWQGTDKYNSAKQLNLILESLGGSFKSFVEAESTHFYLTVPSYNQYKAISFLADIIQHSHFDVQDLVEQKQQLYNNHQSESGETEIINTFAKCLFLQDFGAPIENILQINQDDVIEYLAHQYQTHSSTLVLAGNFEDKQINELVSQEWEFWNPKNQKFVESSTIFNPILPQLPQFLYRQKGTSFTQVSFAFVLDNPNLFPKKQNNAQDNSDFLQDFSNLSNSEQNNQNNYQNNQQNFYQTPNFSQNLANQKQNPFQSQFQSQTQLQTHSQINQIQSFNKFPNQNNDNINENKPTNLRFDQNQSQETPEISKTDKTNKNNQFNSEIYHSFLFEWAKLYLLNTILGQGLSSRLWTKCVEEEMLMEIAQSNLVNFSTCGYFGINTISENTQFSFGLESVLQILESLKKTTVSINELSKAKEFLKGSLILEHEDLLTATVWHVEQNLFSDLPVLLDDLLAVIQTIQAAELRALACDLFTSSKFSLLIMGPNKEIRLIERLVEKYLG